MPKITIVSLLSIGLAPALLGAGALAEPHQSPTAGVEQRMDPKTKAWFDHTIEHMLDESSNVAAVGPAPR